MHLILLCVIGFDGFGLDDNCCITFSHGFAFRGDRARHITRGQSQGHRYRRGYCHSKVLNRLHKALFLNLR